MASPVLAWGEVNLYEVPGDGHLWGREFELLPNGTMLAAGTILRGLIGIEAEPLDRRHCQIRDGAPLVIYGIRSTETRELEPYRDDVIEGFRLAQEQAAQG